MSQFVQAMFDGEAFLFSNVIIAFSRYQLTADVLYGTWFVVVVLEEAPSDRVIGGIRDHVYLLRRIELAKDRVARYRSLEREDCVAMLPRPFLRWYFLLLALQ